MPLKSMTGFGRGSAQAHGVRVEVELISVNRKQLEIAVRLPPSLSAFEPRLQKIVQQTLSRGRVSGTVCVDAPQGKTEVKVDQSGAEAVIEALRSQAKKWSLHDDLGASILVKIPGLLKVQAMEAVSEDCFQTLEKALKMALKKLVTMRSSEGRVLAVDLRDRLNLLEAYLEKIRRLAPNVVTKRRQKMIQGLSLLTRTTVEYPLDKKRNLENWACDERVIKEIALFSERSDITEEVTRLMSHIQQFRARLRTSEPIGRELDFLVQELLREMNTVGSKANDLEITQQVVSFKTELERIREQVQNIE